jgi:hypothetical protein
MPGVAAERALLADDAEMTKPAQTRGDAVAKAIVGGAAVLLAGVFVFLFRRRAFHGDGSLTVFLVASAALALLYASAIVWPRAARLKLLLITFSIVSSLYLCELALMLIGRPAVRPAPVAADPASPVDTRTKLEVIRDLRAAGIDAWPTVHPEVFLGAGGLALAGGETVFPLAGIARVRTVYCNESRSYAIFDSDEQGFNNPVGLHRAGEVDVAVIGDSFAQGACVQPGEDVTARLRASGARALSLGNGGDGPLMELGTLVEYARPLRPRVVLWLYYEGNDLLNLESERVAPALMRYVDGDFSAHLADRQPAIDQALRAFAEKERDATADHEGHVGDKVVGAIKLSALRDRLNVISYPEPSPLFTRTLARAKEVVAGWGGRLYLVYLPEWARYRKKPERVDAKFRSYGQVLEIVKGLDIPVIDFQQTLAATDDPLGNFPGRVAGHYNPAGYARLAEALRARLAADKALP